MNQNTPRAAFTMGCWSDVMVCALAREATNAIVTAKGEGCGTSFPVDGFIVFFSFGFQIAKVYVVLHLTV